MAQGEYELGARVGLGMKMAHEAALKMANVPEDYLGLFGTYAETLIDSVIEIQAKYLAQAAFPNAIAVPYEPVETFRTAGDTRPYEPPQMIGGQQTFAQPPQQVPPPPAPIPNQTRGGGDWKAQKAEANWTTFFQDTTAWEDLRSQKAMGQIKPGNPDWRHRTLKDGEFKMGVWIKDAPMWAVDRLRGMGVTL